MKKTTYQIFDSPAGKTIVFSNLYLINGKFIFNGPAPNDDLSTFPNIHYRFTNFQKWAPQITKLPENQEAQIITTPHFYLKETLHYHPVHTIFDDVFSVFYSLYRCKIDYNQMICVLDIFNNETEEYYDCKGIFKLLFGNEAITLHYLKRSHQQVCFETFVVGNSGSGVSSYDFNYVSPFQDNIWRQFRDAIYKKAEITLGPADKVIYLSRHYDKYDLEERLKDTLKKHNIEVYNYGGKDIKEQLDVLKNVKIYITTSGSNALNSVFLPDNAVVINLGRVYASNDYKIITYGEDYLYPSLSYIDVLYFEDYYSLTINEHDTIPEPNDLIEMVNAVIGEKNPLLMKRNNIYKNFASVVIDKIPAVLKLNNFSPNARLLFENYSVKERIEMIERFKGGNLSFACSEKICHLKNKYK